MLISGPNTGGKTVTLKSIAINYLFLHLGMFIPSKKAKLYPFKKIFYFSHDQQDLKSGLSSFASEAKNYLYLLEEIRNDEALILIDEIFNSTSSEEASALAIALIEEIFKISQSLVFISTHHQFLKAYTHQQKQLISCHVGFDSVKHTPTFKLVLGTPGGSMAFDIFQQLCQNFKLHNNIGNRAREVLESDKLNYENLINELINKQTHLDKVIEENKRTQQQLERKKRQQDGLLLLEKEKILSEFNKKLDKLLAEAQSLSIQVKKGEIGKKGLQRKTSSLQGQARGIDSPQDFEQNLKPSLSIEQLKEGDTV
ncbi:MAG: MutS-related protein, partial [Bacteriovoracaceae bacterium]